MLETFRLQRYIVHTIITRGLSTVLNFLIALIIARHAGPAVKGDVTLLITTIWFVVFFCDVLGGQVLVYVLPRSKLELLIGPAYFWAFIVSLAAYFILFFTHLLPSSFVVPVALIGFLSAVMGIHQSILWSRQEITTANIFALFPLLLQTLGILAFFYGIGIHDARAYILATFISHGIATTLGAFWLRRYILAIRLSSFRLTDELKTLIRYGISYQAIEILQLLNLRYYFFQLGLQQGSRYLGIFSIGISILEAVWIIPRSISTVHYVATSNSAEIRRESQRTVQLLQISLLLSTVALVIIWFVPAWVYTRVFGHGFSDVRHSMRFLFPGIFIYNLWIVISSFYRGTGQYKPLLIIGVLSVVSLIIYGKLLIPHYVMSGAGLAATLSFTTAGLSLALYFSFHNHISLRTYFNTSNLLNTFRQFQKQLINAKH